MNCNSGSTIYEEAVGREGSWARPCDGCCLAPSVVYCHADSAYLCASCDVRIHAANRVASRHERVCLSDAYKHAPAVLECRTDAAAYEAQVHYANLLLAGMHQCVPVAIPAASSFDKAAASTTMLGCKEEEVSWPLLSENSANHNCSGNNSSSSTYFSEVDEYFDLAGYNSYYDSHMNNNQAQYVMQEQQHLEQMQMEYAEKEYVVPSQAATASKQQQQQSGDALVGAVSVPAGVSAYADSFNNSISFSPVEAGIVPDNTVIDMPHSSVLTPAGGSSGISGPPLQMPLQFSSMDREARVLRYKEKKKTRTFQKTTRYATRKAYAEARPRIKGRFAKRSDTEIDLDQMFSTAVLCDTSYSTVPWF